LIAEFQRIKNRERKRRESRAEQREERDSMVVMAYEWHSGFFVFVAVTEYVIVSEKKENRARKRRESRAERESNLWKF
jgi:hypothetical protein